MNITDTHCHLNFNSFNLDLEETIARARANNIVNIIIPGTDISTSKIAISLCEKYSGLYAAVGIHPNDGSTWDNSSFNILREYATHPSVVAIGEIGLDYYRNHTPVDTQKSVFISQLELAAEMDLPVIVHSRNSFDDVWQILSEWHERIEKDHHKMASHPGVLHAFDAGIDDACISISKNFYIGIGGPVTYKSADERKLLVKQIPLENIVLETDSPFLTPEPHRGKRNEPSYTRLIAEKVAELKEKALSEIIEQTEINAANLFGWRAE